MAWTAGHKQEDHVLRGSIELGLLGSQRVLRGRCLRKSALGEEIRKRHRTQADTALIEEPAARNLLRVLPAQSGILTIHRIYSFYSVVMVSSRFNRTRETAVQAAKSTGVTPLGTRASSSLASLPCNPAKSSALNQPSRNRPSCLSRSTSNLRDSASVGWRPRQRRNTNTRRCWLVAPPSRSVLPAKARAESMNNGSFSMVRACSGVFDRARRTQEESPLGASKVCSMGYGRSEERR